MSDLDHLSIPVADLAVARAFYTLALAPLGVGVRMERPGTVAFGRTFPHLWLMQGAPAPEGDKLHLALRAGSRAEVDAFHAAALAAGGRDNGAPGPRPQYHPGYYGAFVLDPDGNNLEAVHHGA